MTGPDSSTVFIFLVCFRIIAWTSLQADTPNSLVNFCKNYVASVSVCSIVVIG